MGLLNNDYESAGPGIAKNAPHKKGIALFFDIFYRKKWKIAGLNLLFFLFFISRSFFFFKRLPAFLLF